MSPPTLTVPMVVFEKIDPDDGRGGAPPGFGRARHSGGTPAAPRLVGWPRAAPPEGARAENGGREGGGEGGAAAAEDPPADDRPSQLVGHDLPRRVAVSGN